MDNNILKEITPIFARILEHNNFELTETSTTEDIDGWDSLTHMIIITEIEEHFNIKFKLVDLMSMENIGELIRAIKNAI